MKKKKKDTSACVGIVSLFQPFFFSHNIFSRKGRSCDDNLRTGKESYAVTTPFTTGKAPFVRTGE